MLRQQFYNGQQFKLNGITGNLCFDIKEEKLLVMKLNKLTVNYVSDVIEDDDNLGFTAELWVFGYKQSVKVKFSHCEELVSSFAAEMDRSTAEQVQ